MERRAIVLAAGKGTRLHCDKVPKAMHEICGRPLLSVVLENTSFISPDDTYIVVGYKKESVKKYFGEKYNYVEQKEQLGTGHAVYQCDKYFKDFEGTVLIAFGDMPLFPKELNEKLCDYHEKSGAACTLLYAVDPKRTEWAHIIKDEKGNFVSVVEGVDCTPEQQKCKELFAGILAFDSKALFNILPLLTNDNKQKEFYLTEAPELLAKKGYKIETFPTDDNDDLCGVNTPEDIKICERILKSREKQPLTV